MFEIDAGHPLLVAAGAIVTVAGVYLAGVKIRET